MASHSHNAAALLQIATIVRTSERMQAKAYNDLLVARNQLAAIPTQFAGPIAEIEAYVPTGARETLSKDDAAKLTGEYVDRKNSLEDDLTALGISF